MSHVFISSKDKAEDVAFAQKLIQKIEEETGLDTWYFKNNLEAGRRWAPEIDEAIEGCIALIVVVSEEANRSTFVTYEWALAEGLPPTIIPVLIQRTESTHPRLDTHQRIDFSSGESWDELIDTLQSLASQNQYKIFPPTNSSSTIRDAADRLTSALPQERQAALQTLRAVDVNSIDGEATRKVLFQAATVMPIESDREAAIFILGDVFNDQRAAPLLVRILREHKDDRRRADAASILGHVGSEGEVDALCEALDDSQSRVRHRAIDSLGLIGSSAAIPCIQDALLQSDGQSRMRAAIALGRIGDPSAVEALTEVFSGDSAQHVSDGVRHEAAFALGQIGGEEAASALRGVADNTQAPIVLRQYSVEALGGLRQPPDWVVPLLVEQLRSGDYTLCCAAAMALGKIGDPRAIDALTACQQKTARATRPLHYAPEGMSRSPRISECATWALANITN